MWGTLDMAGEPDHYAILNVPQGIKSEDIKAAYLQRIGEYHPDRVASLGAEIREVAERRSKQINEAYSVLSDPKKRASYDVRRAASMRSSSTSSEPSSAGSASTSSSGFSERGRAETGQRDATGDARSSGQAGASQADSASAAGPKKKRSNPVVVVIWLLIIIASVWRLFAGGHSAPTGPLVAASDPPSGALAKVPQPSASKPVSLPVAAAPPAEALQDTPPIAPRPSLAVGPSTVADWQKMFYDQREQVDYYADMRSITTLKNGRVSLIAKSVGRSDRIMPDGTRYKTAIVFASIDCRNETFGLSSFDAYDESDKIIYTEHRPPGRIEVTPVIVGSIGDLELRFACSRVAASAPQNAAADLNGLY